MIFSFWRRERPTDDIEERLGALEDGAEGAATGFEAQFYNRAGDLCLEEDERDRALGYYGRAIDAYLEASRFDAAVAVCRKLLRIAPGAVRARCTLAWLCIGKELGGDARVELRNYVRAARTADQARLAIEHLRLMGAVAAEPELVRLIAELLEELGAGAAAEELARDAERESEAPDATPVDRWSDVLHAALMDPGDLSARDEGSPPDD